MERQKWTEHSFTTDIDVGWTSNILCRLSDTAVRIQNHCKELNAMVLSRKIGDDWSIKEHIGHMFDLEELHQSRLAEFSKNEPLLSAADMSNQKTENADYNTKSYQELITKFSIARKVTLRSYYTLTKQNLLHQALHPRLQIQMRPVDMLFFMAEHDDHHIASIIELINKLG